VLIFDSSGQDRLMPYLQKWQPAILHVGLEQISLPVLVLSLFRKGDFSTAYFGCYIDLVHPRLIVTFIDNNPNFYSLSSRHPYAKTMFVQNAIRSYYVDIFEFPSTDEIARALARACSMIGGFRTTRAIGGIEKKSHQLNRSACRRFSNFVGFRNSVFKFLFSFLFSISRILVFSKCNREAMNSGSEAQNMQFDGEPAASEAQNVGTKMDALITFQSLMCSLTANLLL
jgi:hypothetical protein